METGQEPETEAGSQEAVRIALLGNPNTGKTTLFNRISGLRHKTSNFPGTTLEARLTRVRAGVEGGRDADLVDLPGMYSLELDQLESRVCREVLAGLAAPSGERMGSPEVCVVVVDSTNLARNLMLVGEVIRRRLPTVVVLNMMDLASKQGLVLDRGALEASLGCEVVCTAAREGSGVDEVRRAIRRARIPTPSVPVPASVETLRGWADQMYLRAITEPEPMYGLKESFSDRLDRALLHPLAGAGAFGVVMTGLFFVIFKLAEYPMRGIEWFFDEAVGRASGALPEGILSDLMTNGVLAGIGSTVVFLPQICLLFFLISVLEDTGYLARASFVMDRVLRPFGLPGQAFVPMLSSHACALPGIMSARSIPDAKQRLAAILAAPFMSCSARLPVYILLTSLLFPTEPTNAALAFTGCYVLGMVAGMGSALIARRTILRGKPRAMAMELPSYKKPSLRTALLTTRDRAWVFLKNAGTLILAISIVLWWLGEYPKVEAPASAQELRAYAEARERAERAARSGEASSERGEGEELLSLEEAMSLPTPTGMTLSPFTPAEEARAMAEVIEARHQSSRSFMGRIGKTVEPIFQPMDWDWRVCIGVMSSFAAREVFVATMSVVITGESRDDARERTLVESLRSATRDDGRTPIFSPAVSWSLLVFYVLAMQCLPTLAVTARETGGGRSGMKWAMLQLAWMSAVAYTAAAITFAIVSRV